MKTMGMISHITTIFTPKILLHTNPESMAHLVSFISPLIWPHHPWFAAANFERALTRTYWKVCRALARVLAPPPSRFLVLFLLVVEWVCSFLFSWLQYFGCIGWVNSGSASESWVGYVSRDVWLGLLTYRYLVPHGGDWWFVHLQSWNFSLLVAAAWSFSLVAATARFFVLYFMYFMFNVGFMLDVGVMPPCGLYASLLALDVLGFGSGT
ncbi:hypothetical protein ACE6H2_002368 [Prunus campanulata]